MRGILTTTRHKHNASSLRQFQLSCRPKWRDPFGVRLRLFGYCQPATFPGFEAASHGANVFVPHFLQTLGGEGGPSTSPAMTNDHRVVVRDFFLDVELDRSATHVNRIRNMFLVPFVFLPNIDDYRFAAL